jgi:hypothetical protein
MCDERERLIGYVYDDCAPAERAAIARHLDECEGCQDEIRALRDVRHDLLAWEVPDHPPVWKAFAPPRVRATWRDIPAWALAAAASLMFLAGASGGVLTHVLWPHEQVAVVAQTPPPAVVAPASFTDADLAAREHDFEQRLLARMRTELETRMRAASAAPQLVNASLADLERLLDRQKLQDNFNNSVYRDVLRMTERVNNIEKTTSQMQQVGGLGAGPGK